MHLDNFDNLIIKFLENTISDDEATILTLWLESEENKAYFNDFVSISYLTNMQSSIDHKASLAELKQTIRRRSKSKKLRIFKYAIAASLVISISIPLFLMNKNVEVETPEIVHNNISIGSDKAVLTLFDGTEVALEKGQHYQTDNVNSTGTTLVYTPSKIAASNIRYNYLTIPRGGQYMVTLSDGTKVWLNSESKLKYPVNFKQGASRKVELVYGEAYFEVSPSTKHKGADFIVSNELQNVVVLGTAFNIRSYKEDSDISTTLVEGRIKIEFDKALKEVLLAPNQQFKANKSGGGTSLLTVNVNDFTSWKKGVFSFKNMPFEEIMKTLSRWYDVEVVFVNETVKKIPFRGVLSKKQRLEDLLTIFKSTNNFDFEIRDKTVLIK